MTARKKPPQDETLFADSETKVSEAAKVEASILEDVSDLEDLNTATDRQLGHAALEEELHKEEVEASGDFYDDLDVISDNENLETPAQVTDHERELIRNLVHNGGISERTAEKRVLGIKRARELRDEKKPRRSASSGRPRGTDIPASRLSLKEKAARDRNSVPPHERPPQPPIIRGGRIVE